VGRGRVITTGDLGLSAHPLLQGSAQILQPSLCPLIANQLGVGFNPRLTTDQRNRLDRQVHGDGDGVEG
jgi:hypothetical protein